MSEIRLFRLTGEKAIEVAGVAGGLEKSLQKLIEKNLETMFGIRFLKTEYATGKLHGGRIDTLGLDEDGCPVILEYKRALNENVINQGLFYLDWLLDHKAEFKLLVMEAFDKDVADEIDWKVPRLICVAANFTKHDEHAVRQINRYIDLVRYRRFGSDLLALELVASTTADAVAAVPSPEKKKAGKPIDDKPALPDGPIGDLYEELRAFLLALGDDVTEKHAKLYIAFRRTMNFAEVKVQKNALVVFLKIDPQSVTLEEGFSRNVAEIGHHGTGNLELTIRTNADLKKAEPLLVRSYDGK
jgi:predicted transport protein